MIIIIFNDSDNNKLFWQDNVSVYAILSSLGSRNTIIALQYHKGPAISLGSCNIIRALQYHKDPALYIDFSQRTKMLAICFFIHDHYELNKVVMSFTIIMSL